jgi:hypothetical protein
VLPRLFGEAPAGQLVFDDGAGSRRDRRLSLQLDYVHEAIPAANLAPAV